MPNARSKMNTAFLAFSNGAKHPRVHASSTAFVRRRHLMRDLQLMQHADSSQSFGNYVNSRKLQNILYSLINITEPICQSRKYVNLTREQILRLHWNFNIIQLSVPINMCTTLTICIVDAGSKLPPTANASLSSIPDCMVQAAPSLGQAVCLIICPFVCGDDMIHISIC